MCRRPGGEGGEGEGGGVVEAGGLGLEGAVGYARGFVSCVSVLLRALLSLACRKCLEVQAKSRWVLLAGRVPYFAFTSSALVSTTRRTRDRPFLCFKVVETRRDRACLPGGRDSRMVPLVMSFGARLIRCRGRVEGVWGRLRNLPVLGRALQGLKALLYWISCALALGIYIYII